MARLRVPEGEGPEVDRVWDINPEIGDPARALREAVYQRNHLPLRVHEAVRYLIADCNQCPHCLAARRYAEAEGLDEAFYAAVLEDRRSSIFNEREQLALEYAHRFCFDHLSIDDELFENLHREFSDVEVFDLCATVARHLAFGRFTAVTQTEVACAIDEPSSVNAFGLSMQDS